MSHAFLHAELGVIVKTRLSMIRPSPPETHSLQCATPGGGREETNSLLREMCLLRQSGDPNCRIRAAVQHQSLADAYHTLQSGTRSRSALDRNSVVVQLTAHQTAYGQYYWCSNACQTLPEVEANVTHAALSSRCIDTLSNNVPVAFLHNRQQMSALSRHCA